DAVADADADADAVAVADADAVAVAVADAVAVAVAVADAVAAWGTKQWSETCNRVYAEVKAHIEATYAPVAEQVQDSALQLFHAMVRPATD
ncbi:MAG TPA: hypothetical protein VFC19_49520, partial [Candidatus Limnocylindrales bacterium]|nr:hypothetical protein [Candidatus Limnocylindrales bacterium]